MSGVFSTRQAAKELGISPIALSRYIASGKVPAPKAIAIGGWKLHTWTREEIEYVRQLLPKIANGRKTRWQKVRKKQKTPPRAHSTRSASSLRAGLVPHQSRSKKKK